MASLGTQDIQKGAACFAYGLISTSITLFNKAVFAKFHFNYPNLVTSMQIAISIFYMLVIKSFGLAHIDRLPSRTLHKVMPMTICWWLYVVSGITALRYMSVPMFSVLRRGTTPLVVAGEFIVFAKTPRRRNLVEIASQKATPQIGATHAAITIMVTGAVMAGAKEISFNLLGCFWVMVCTVSTAAYLILIKVQKETLGLSPFSLLFYNNIFALPMMLIYLMCASNEATMVASFPQLHSLAFWIFLLASVSQAFLLNLCIFWCTTINSPLATTITGQMKDILTTAFGMMLFGDSDTSGQALAGIGAGLLGAMAYSYFSYCDMNQEPVASEERTRLAHSSQGSGYSLAQDDEMAVSMVTKQQEVSCEDVESPSPHAPLIKAYRPEAVPILS